MRFWLSVWNNRKRSAPVFCLCGAHTIHTHSTSSQKPFAAPSEAKTHSLSQASTSFAMELRLGLLSFLSLLQAMALSLSLTHSLHLWFSTEQFFFKSNSMTAFYSSSFSRFRGCNSNRVCLCVCLFFFFSKILHTLFGYHEIGPGEQLAREGQLWNFNFICLRVGNGGRTKKDFEMLEYFGNGVMDYESPVYYVKRAFCIHFSFLLLISFFVFTIYRTNFLKWKTNWKQYINFVINLK